MIVTFLRSSSIGTLSMCEMQYFFEYVLGRKNKTNRKAVMGTVMHRVLQVLGDKKIAISKGQNLVVNDDIPNLTFEQCDNIDYITNLCFEYYKEHEYPDLEHKDKLLIIAWVYKALAYKNGMLDPRNQEVHATELFFDIEIKKPWAKYKYNVAGEEFSGYLGIKGTVDLIIKEDDNYFQVLDYKGLPIETPILTNEGWSTMGELSVGDVVYDRFGQQTKINGKSAVKNKECYKITFDDKSTVECDDEHYWTLSDNNVVQSPDLKVGMTIDVAQPIHNPDRDLPIDPYALGLWLGDGRNRSFEITCGDTEVFQEIKNRGFTLGVDQYRNDSSRNCECRTVMGLTSTLKELDLLNNKHIPEMYLTGSYKQRIDLLRGLMDSDGSVNVLRKQCVFMNCNKKLSEDVKLLLLSLGQRPYLCTTKQKYKNSHVFCYPVFFRPININPFYLKRKSSKIDKSWGTGLSHRRKILKIEKIGKKLTQCISVDSVDKTYLCTKNLIPTHNSGRRLNWATGKEKTQADLEKDPQLLLYYYALKTLYPDQSFYVSIYYVNDGGLFDIVFTDDDFEKAEKMIRQRFEYIRSVEMPKQISRDQSHWKCQKLCGFSILEKDGKTACQCMRENIEYYGMDETVRLYGDMEKINAYGAGGGRLDKGSE